MTRTYTESEKLTALEALRERGAATASRETGIPRSTIRGWAEAAGIDAGPSDATCRRARANWVHWVERRQATAAELGDLIAEALGVVRTKLRLAAAGESAAEAQRAATALAILIDKADKLTPLASLEDDDTKPPMTEEMADIQALADKAARIAASLTADVTTHPEAV